jgi:ATP-dependent helicase IRC3
MGNTEGFDMPSISCVILAAPTKSGVVFSQRVGRGTRLFEGKKDCIILDLVDSTTRHNLITLPTLLGLPAGLNLKGRGLVESAKLVEEKLKQEPRIDVNKILDMDKLDSYVEEVDLFAVHLPSDVEKNSTFTWFPSYDGGYRLLLPNKDEVKITKNLLDKFEICGKLKDKKYRGERSSLSEAFSAADELVTKYAPDYLKVVRQVETWHNELPTEKQLKHLKKIYKGKELPATLNRGEAHKLLSAHWAGKEDKRRKPAWLKSRKSNLT